MPSPDDLPALLGGRPVRPEGPPNWPPEDPATREVLARLAADGAWGRYHGPYGDGLIERLRELLGCRHAILCSSGTAAVELALRGLLVGPGDEVLLSAYDFKSNFTNIVTLGATPVLVDVREADCQLDVSQLEAGITPRTRAVIVSHLQGGLVDVRRVREIAAAHDVPMVEDACQSPGARVQGRPAGTWGDAGVFSFGGSKLLTAGRGGAVVTDRDDVAQRIRLYTQRGNEAYPLSEMQAAVLGPQVEQLADRTLKRAANVRALTDRLSSGETETGAGAGAGAGVGLRMFEVPMSDSLPAYYKVGFWYDPAEFAGLPRVRFCEALRAEGIAFDAGFRGLHRIHARRRFRQIGPLPLAAGADERIVVLHHPVLLGSGEDIAHIPAALAKIRRHATMLKE